MVMISVATEDDEYRKLINTDCIDTIEKAEAECGCYSHCPHTIKTKIIMKDGRIFITEDSINTLEARININTEKESHVSG